MDSAGNVLQIRSVSVERLIKYVGVVSADVVANLLDSLMICLDYEMD